MQGDIMRPMMRLVIDSRLSEIRRASELVDEFKARHGLADDDANAIHIVLDEVLSNSIRHGLAGAASHAIAVMLELSDGEAGGPRRVVAFSRDGASVRMLAQGELQRETARRICRTPDATPYEIVAVADGHAILVRPGWFAGK